MLHNAKFHGSVFHVKLLINNYNGCGLWFIHLGVTLGCGSMVHEATLKNLRPMQLQLTALLVQEYMHVSMSVLL